VLVLQWNVLSLLVNIRSLCAAGLQLNTIGPNCTCASDTCVCVFTGVSRQIPVLTVHLHQIPVYVFTGLSHQIPVLTVHLHQIPVCVFTGVSCQIPVLTLHLHQISLCVCVFTGVSHQIPVLTVHLHQIPVCVFTRHGIGFKAHMQINFVNSLN